MSIFDQSDFWRQVLNLSALKLFRSAQNLLECGTAREVEQLINPGVVYRETALVTALLQGLRDRTVFCLVGPNLLGRSQGVLVSSHSFQGVINFVETTFFDEAFLHLLTGVSAMRDSVRSASSEGASDIEMGDAERIRQEEDSADSFDRDGISGTFRIKQRTDIGTAIRRDRSPDRSRSPDRTITRMLQPGDFISIELDDGGGRSADDDPPVDTEVDPGTYKLVHFKAPEPKPKKKRQKLDGQGSDQYEVSEYVDLSPDKLVRAMEETPELTGRGGVVELTDGQIRPALSLETGDIVLPRSSTAAALDLHPPGQKETAQRRHELLEGAVVDESEDTPDVDSAGRTTPVQDVFGGSTRPGEFARTGPASLASNVTDSGKSLRISSAAPTGSKEASSVAEDEQIPKVPDGEEMSLFDSGFIHTGIPDSHAPPQLPVGPIHSGESTEHADLLPSKLLHREIHSEEASQNPKVNISQADIRTYNPILDNSEPPKQLVDRQRPKSETDSTDLQDLENLRSISSVTEQTKPHVERYGALNLSRAHAADTLESRGTPGPGGRFSAETETPARRPAGREAQLGDTDIVSVVVPPGLFPEVNQGLLALEAGNNQSEEDEEEGARQHITLVSRSTVRHPSSERDAAAERRFSRELVQGAGSVTECDMLIAGIEPLPQPDEARAKGEIFIFRSESRPVSRCVLLGQTVPNKNGISREF